MIRVALKGLAARPVRTALTTLAIVIGVAFVCAAYTLTDTMSGAADSLTHAAYDGTDAVVVTKTAFRGSQTSDVRAQAPTIPAGALAKVRGADGRERSRSATSPTRRRSSAPTASRSAPARTSASASTRTRPAPSA